MVEPRRLAAIDLGAESGRVVLGRLDADRVTLEVVHRFANSPLRLPDGLHWNVLELFAQVLAGLRAAAAGGLDGIGVDAWGCDYAWLDRSHQLLGVPFHYRDERRTLPELMQRAHARVSRAELYRRTGIQSIPINTVFQLCAEEDGAAPWAAERIALMPDLFALWLTGALANELTVASTTGLLEARGRRWAVDLIAELGLPDRPFSGEVVAPGTEIGAVLERHESAGAATGVPVYTVAGHDTASAFAAAPLAGAGAAVLSSGTWSLLGVELREPRLDAEAAAYNMTNERGVDDTARLLRNVMGLWLVQECRREWAAAGAAASDYEQLQRLAGQARADAPVFDPDHQSLLARGGMTARICALCEDTGQAAPAGRAELLRSILASLACKYRLVVEQLERLGGRPIELINVVGGGACNRLLCQLTADVLQREVVAGPIEATALGNVLLQARAQGQLSSLSELRELVAGSVAPQRFEPGRAEQADEIYRRFLAVTGLADRRDVEAVART